MDILGAHLSTILLSYRLLHGTTVFLLTLVVANLAQSDGNIDIRPGSTTKCKLAGPQRATLLDPYSVDSSCPRSLQTGFRLVHS
jgi:hypothetical protein